MNETNEKYMLTINGIYELIKMDSLNMNIIKELVKFYNRVN